MATPDYAEALSLLTTPADLDCLVQEDLQEVAKSLRSSSTRQFSRRQAIRSLFSCIEALNYSTKRKAEIFAVLKSVTLTAGELAIIREVSYQIDDPGSIREAQLLLNFQPKVRFAMCLLARVLEIDPPDFGSAGWRDLVKAAKIRNRLSHPTCPADLHVSDEDVELVGSGCGWLTGATRHFNTATEVFISDLRNELMVKGLIQGCE